jgi:hypothetical protein
MRAMPWLVFLTLSACSRPGEENLGLSGKPASYAIDVAQLSRPGELLRALAMPGREIDKRLGARRLDASSTLKVETAGKPAETLEETYRLDTDGRGGLKLVHDNSRSYGVEAVVAGGDLYVRPRYGKMVRRKPDGDEVDRLRASVEGVAGDYLELVERWLQVREEGRTQVAGRAAVRLKLSAGASPTPLAPSTDPSRKWRETVTVRFIDGEILLDVGSGALVGARLETSYTFERDGKPFTTTLSFKETTLPAEPIVTPTDAVAAPHRPRPMLDRQELLEGLK